MWDPRVKNAGSGELFASPPTQLIGVGGHWQACLFLKDKPFVAQASTHSSWLGFLPYARGPALGANLTVRTEVVHPLMLVASVTCGYSKHTGSQRASCYLRKNVSSLLSCQSGFNHTKSPVMVPTDCAPKKGRASGLGLWPSPYKSTFGHEASCLSCAP